MRFMKYFVSFGGKMVEKCKVLNIIFLERKEEKKMFILWGVLVLNYFSGGI